MLTASNILNEGLYAKDVNNNEPLDQIQQLSARIFAAAPCRDPDEIRFIRELLQITHSKRVHLIEHNFASECVAAHRISRKLPQHTISVLF
jgi:hypothetical protein